MLSPWTIWRALGWHNTCVSAMPKLREGEFWLTLPTLHHPHFKSVPIPNADREMGRCEREIATCWRHPHFKQQMCV